MVHHVWISRFFLSNPFSADIVSIGLLSFVIIQIFVQSIFRCLDHYVFYRQHCHKSLDIFSITRNGFFLIHHVNGQCWRVRRYYPLNLWENLVGKLTNELLCDGQSLISSSSHKIWPAHAFHHYVCVTWRFRRLYTFDWKYFIDLYPVGFVASSHLGCTVSSRIKMVLAATVKTQLMRPILFLLKSMKLDSS